MPHAYSLRRSLFSLFGFLLCVASSPAQTRVAFLGDSITAGQGAGSTREDAAYGSFPSVAGRLLGPEFEVKGFGAHGHSLRTDAKQVYAESKAFEDALLFRPEIAVIMLGTNDSAVEEEAHDWRAALDRIVVPLREVSPGVRVLLASPPDMFPTQSRRDEKRKEWLEARRPRLHRLSESLRRLAPKVDAEFVNMRGVLRPRHVTDGVHPTAFGAEQLAYRLAGAIQSAEDTSLTPASQLLALRPGAELSDFHGFRRYGFALKAEGSPKCFLVVPDRVRAGVPWIWRARFFGHQPALDKALLDRGFHVAYVDVAGLFGSPQAVKRMGAFHDFCTGLGLAEKPVLEGMSRGGLAVMEYAKAYPQRVAAIYADNPVADIRSWPGGRSGKRADDAWEQAKQQWGLEGDAAWGFQGGPLADLEALGKEQVPLMLVIGTADKVVPPHENGELLRKAYLAAGGPVRIWRKPGKDHHPHGLNPVGPLLRELLVAAGVHTAESEPTVTPIPSAEFRGKAAGWGGGTWRTAFASLEALSEAAASEPPMDVVFFGDSITQSLTGHGERLAKPDGARAFDKAHRGRRAVSLGLSGDRTEHLLYRIAQGSLDEFRPRVIVLQIGVNNINAAEHGAEETYRGIVRVVEALRERLHDADVLITGPFPSGKERGARVRQSVEHVHSRLAAHSFPDGVHYLNLTPVFMDEGGVPLPTMGRDCIHITDEGRAAWMSAIEPALARLLDGALPK